MDINMLRNTGKVNMRAVRIIVICLALLAAMALLAGCRNPFSRRKSAAPHPEQATAAYTLTCPIDGLPITTEQLVQRPLAVMVENSPAARPQSGLNDACVVYEAITEGGITRFLAIYHHGTPETIGPVRSARPHFIHFAREFDAAYAHCGQSQEALEMLVTTPRILNLDQMKFGKAFWRERSRRAPHNLYTSVQRLQAVVKKQRWGGAPSELPVFTSDRLLKQGEPANDIKINFNGSVRYSLNFTYDAERKGYLRYMDGKLHADRETGKPVVAKNIIIQRAEAMQFPDSKYQTFDVVVIGSGMGTFISNRRQIPLQWQKQWSGGITEYTDSSGKALPFQPGQTWIEVLPPEGIVNITTPPPAPATPAR